MGVPALVVAAEHGLHHLVDVRMVAVPHAHVRQQLQKVGLVVGAVMPRSSRVVAPMTQTADQIHSTGILENRRMGQYHVGIICRPIEELGEHHPAGRRFLALQQPRPRIGSEQIKPRFFVHLARNLHLAWRPLPPKTFRASPARRKAYPAESTKASLRLTKVPAIGRI